MNMKKFFLTAVAALLCTAMMGADKKVDVSLYGFVANQMYWQDRAEYQAVDGLLNFFPKDNSYNSKGEDMNEDFNSSMISIITRLGVTVKGPEILNATPSAQIEGDFSASGMTFFLRQAFIRFDWDKSRLTFGQTGHPMCTDLMPGTINIAIGSPFNALNRSPMLRFDCFLNDKKSVTLTGAAIYQYQSGSSTGPDGKTFQYFRNSNVPELWFGISGKTGGFNVEAGFDWLQLSPRKVNDYGLKISERFSQWAAMLQMSYSHAAFSIKAKSLYGYNMSHLNLATGYGVSAINSDGSYEYAPLKATSSWVFASYGRTWRAGLFLGFMKNLGADKDLILNDNGKNLLWVYGGKDNNIDLIYRVCPQIEYLVGNFTFGLEYEMTTTAYGKKIESNGRVSDTHNVSNNRVMLSAKYSF